MHTLRFLMLMVFMAFPSAVFAADTLMMSTTTSVHDSGLLDYLKPVLLRETGIDLKWVSISASKALEQGKNCAVDVLLMHDPDAELKMVEAGIAIDRREIMYNIEENSDLLNQYSVMTVNPARCPKVKARLARIFTEWWVCPPTQNLIAAFRREGKQHFFPNAPPPSR